MKITIECTPSELAELMNKKTDIKIEPPKLPSDAMPKAFIEMLKKEMR